jgi:DMSO reductase family type II enzyme heme b subunit
MSGNGPPTPRLLGLWVFALPFLIVLLFLIQHRTPSSTDPPRLPEPPPRRAPDYTAALVESGKALYARHCALCHGADGKGKGPAAYLLYPKPRNLTTRSFRLTSNLEGVVALEDVFDTLARGMPGTCMPSYEILSEDERWAVTFYVKSLGRPDKKKPATIAAGPELPATPAALAHGRQLFLQACTTCHGQTGRGDGPQEQLDTDGYRNRPRDLTRGIFKGGREDRQLYFRIAAGLPGTSMPSHAAALKPKDIWDAMHYVQTLSDPVAQQRNEQHLRTLTARNFAPAELQEPGGGAWSRIEATSLALMPLWFRDVRPEAVLVRAAHDGRDIFLQLSWPDATEDAGQRDGFCDGAAVQFAPAGSVPPLFAMGEKDLPVSIWHWRAGHTVDVRAHCPQMHPAAEEVQRDPLFLTGLAAGNSVLSKGPAESLSAHGLTTLSAETDGDLSAKALWADGRYSVVFRRKLAQNGKGLAITPGQSYFVAFACWDGSAGERGGQKCVTIWHRLQVER